MAQTAEERKAAQRASKREWYTDNTEEARERSRQYREAHREEARASQRKWREEHKERVRENHRKYRETHRDRKRECGRQWRIAHPEAHLKHKYGITPAEKEQLLVAQRGVCAICGGNRSKRELGVDHDHSTKQVRGLLCGPCNLGLGHFADNPAWLNNAIRYLEKTSNSTGLT